MLFSSFFQFLGIRSGWIVDFMDLGDFGTVEFGVGGGVRMEGESSSGEIRFIIVKFLNLPSVPFITGILIFMLN
jgi:hypothetical protein